MASRTPTPVDGVAQQADDSTAEVAPVAATSPEAAAEVSAEEPDAEIVDEERTIPARILVDFQEFKANTFALLTEAEATVCAGWADLEQAAVDYVKSLAD